ncbi:MAG: hypothetical protein WBB28_18020 [Crinalium sp.]
MENRIPVRILVFTAIGWIGFIVLGSQKIASQLVPEVCPAKTADTYVVFVKHRWGVDYSYLNKLSQLHRWNIIEKCTWVTPSSEVSGKTYPSTSSVVTQIGPFTDADNPHSAFKEIAENVYVNRCKPDLTDNPIMMNKSR